MHPPVKEKDNRNKIRIGITHGDFNSISYEVIVKALSDQRMFESFTPVIYGLSKVLSYNLKNFKFADFNFKIIKDPAQAFAQKVNVVNISHEEVKIDYGKPTDLAGVHALAALEQAVADLKDDKIQAVITGPINKANIQSEKFNFPGHTEFFTQRFNVENSLMLMVQNNLRIATVTGHIALKEVANTITHELISKKITILSDSMKRDFLISHPKIAVLSLNPHAGDKGLIGNEDQEVVQLAIDNEQNKGRLVFGPFPADGFFGSDEYLKYDAILAMYHDQGLIPFKTLAFEGGVNFTAGLPIVRTSPAHGTAYEKAGKNEASEKAMREAIYLAVDIFENRTAFDEMNRNPLKSGLLNDMHNGKNHREPAEFRDMHG